MKHWILGMLKPVARTGLAAKTVTAAAMAAVLALASCTRYEPDKHGKAGAEGTKVVLAFSPNIGGMPATSPAASRAGYHGDISGDAALAENNLLDRQIAEVRVLFYNPTTGALKFNERFTISNAPNPETITVITGAYDVVFIASESSNGSAVSPFLKYFLATEANYDHTDELKTALIESAAYSNAKDIPMFGIVRNVQIINNHTINWGEGTKDTRTEPWAPELTRTGARISLELTIDRSHFDEWINTGITMSLANVPASVYLQPQSNKYNDASREAASRTYTADAAANVSAPAPVEGYDGYYWPVYVTSGPTTQIDHYIVRFDRIIVPELLFEDIDDADKAMELQITIGGNTLKAKINTYDPATQIHNYTLPRNTWLHLDAKVNNTTLELNPIVMNWNTISMGDITFDGKYFLKVDRDIIAFTAAGGEQNYSITTNYPETISIQWSGGVPPGGFIIGSTGTVSNSINPGGIHTFVNPYFKLSTNTGTAPRVATFIITAGNMRKTIKVGQMGAKDDTPPAGVTPYVGAFWKADQTGERLIRIPRQANGSIDGPWTATVETGGDWIAVDRIMTDDPNVGWLDGANEQQAALGNDHGFDDQYAVYGTANMVTGTVKNSDPHGIYFRIGLKSRYIPTEAAPARYGVILLTYTNGNALKFQRIFIRQGEGADYLMRPGDPSTGTATDRASARRWSPYNITAQEFTGAGVSPGTNPWVNVRPLASEPSSAVFTEYPTQAGGVFRWAHREGVRAYNPSGITISGWGAQSASNLYNGSAWSTLSNTYESCPPGYRRPTDGKTNVRNQTSVLIADSELQQSLLVNGVTGGYQTPAAGASNIVSGYYADGFFDRRLIGDNPSDPYYVAKAAVNINNSAVAYKGMLFYNPYSNASIFFPYAGHRKSDTGRLESAGFNSGFWSSSSYGAYSGSSIDYSWWFSFSGDGALFARRHYTLRGYAWPVRCVVDPPIPPGMGGGGTPPTSGSIAPENILAVNNLGQLNLDGQRYVNQPGTGITYNRIVYFKWGSLVAYSANVVAAWVPKEYTGTLPASANGNWTQVPYVKEFDALPAIPDLEAALGDPCMVATKNGGEVGQWRMMTYTGTAFENLSSFTRMNGSYTHSDGINYGSRGGILSNIDGQFYPVASLLNATTNNNSVTPAINSNLENDISYWSSTLHPSANTYPDRYYVYSWDGETTIHGERWDGRPIRCLPK